MKLIEALLESNNNSNYRLVYLKKYKKDLTRLEKISNNWEKDFNKLKPILEGLKVGKLPPTEINRPHKIMLKPKGLRQYNPAWDIHVGSANSNWILIINIDKKSKVVYFIATGDHSYLSKTM